MQRDNRGVAPDSPWGEDNDKDPDEAAHHRQVQQEERRRCGGGRLFADVWEDAEEPRSIFGVIEQEEGQEMMSK